ncbi:MAG: PIN domain-containing protein [Candidatus Omnitrophota bacterium]|nr:PIN domain-containing protein [Candidatus Omnitrophota bacterium]
MTIKLIRVFFMFLAVVCGYYIGSQFTGLLSQKALIGAGIGAVCSILLILMELKLQRVSLRNLSAAAFGLVFGFFMAWMMTLILRLIPMGGIYYSVFQIIFTLVFCYLGIVISIKGKDEFNLIIPYIRFSREEQRDQLYLLDTSVIIDGRIAGVCESGFLEGKLVVPRFVLQELQQIADSSDDSMRTRGRRGLDILDRLKKFQGTEVIIHDESLPDIREVDAKLVRMAKILDCYVLTNDFNLNKVAKLEGVRVLNINDLANALRPVVFPGEQMNVYIRKEGKERNQGVAFMDDGTMIVVDNARRMIGKNINVSVSSVLQTSAGRMIFANLVDRPEYPKKQNNRYREREAE